MMSTRSGSSSSMNDDLISIAPMMEWTTFQFRYLVRLLSKRAKLYTEMVVDSTLNYSPRKMDFTLFDEVEHPVVFQLGGSNPSSLAQAAKYVASRGFDEINLNCGCPSPRVSGKGKFGAALMFTPELVRDCVSAIRSAAGIPVTVKCRLGADDMDSYEEFKNFIAVVSGSGACSHFIIHARKCFLNGLDPKKNRTVPPLKYHWVQQIAVEFPELRFSINGGINSLQEAADLLSLRRPAGSVIASLGADLESVKEKRSSEVPESAQIIPEEEEQEQVEDGTSFSECGCSDFTSGPAAARDSSKDDAEASEDQPPVSAFQYDLAPGVVRLPGCNPATYGDASGGLLSGVMIGRAAYNNPWILSDVDRSIYGEANPGYSRREIIHKYVDHMEATIEKANADYQDRQLPGCFRPTEFAKPLYFLFVGERGGARFRSTLSICVAEKKMGFRESLDLAMQHLSDDVLDAKPPE
jgi:tRNA-dihydrouridine synthase